MTFFYKFVFLVSAHQTKSWFKKNLILEGKDRSFDSYCSFCLGALVQLIMLKYFFIKTVQLCDNILMNTKLIHFFIPSLSRRVKSKIKFFASRQGEEKHFFGTFKLRKCEYAVVSNIIFRVLCVLFSYSGTY